MTRARGLAVVVVVAVAGVGGCGPGKLDDARTFSLPQDGDRDKELLLKPQSSEQQVKVQVTATEPVDVYVFLTKDVAEPQDLLPPDRQKKALGSTLGTTDGTFTVKVPANAEYKVLISLAEKSKKADVKVRLTN